MIKARDIRAILSASKWSQAQLAQRVGVQQPTVSRWVSGGTIDREYHLRIIELMTTLNLHQLAITHPNIINVPLVSWVAAGQWQESQIINHWDELPIVQAVGLPSGRWIALKVEGSSMNLIAPPGALIFINRNEKNLFTGRDYVISFEGNATFKRYFARPDRFEPYSNDPSHKTLFPHEEVNVIGRVERIQVDY